MNDITPGDHVPENFINDFDISHIPMDGQGLLTPRVETKTTEQNPETIPSKKEH
jgi:hypothetical protein